MHVTFTKIQEILEMEDREEAFHRIAKIYLEGPEDVRDLIIPTVLMTDSSSH